PGGPLPGGRRRLRGFGLHSKRRRRGTRIDTGIEIASEFIQVSVIYRLYGIKSLYASGRRPEAGVQSPTPMGGDGTEGDVSRLTRRVQELEEALAKRELKANAAELPLLPAILHAREATLADAERAAQLGTWVWDTRAERVTWSPELYRILGRDPGKDVPSV